MNNNIADQIVAKFKEEHHTYECFLIAVNSFFQLNPALNKAPLPIIHSLKTRLKDPDHLIKKLVRKHDSDNPITMENAFDRITDLAGIRVLHLYRQQFSDIHRAIDSKVKEGDWTYFEDPCAYTWDPETEQFYRELGISVQIRETHYTSVHYIVMPKTNSPIKCEIQVRTLFEEIWGEMDHYINYPEATNSVACREQLRVLSKLSATGTRLADSIFESHQEYLTLRR